MKSRLRLVVRGRVQGVGFRWFVSEEAGALGLSGRVWNRDDGAVELDYEGDADAIEALKAAVRVGPPAARVDSIEEN